VPTNKPFPAGSVALIEGLSMVGDLALPLGELTAQADATRTRLDELIAQNPEHQAMLRQLEAAWEQSEPSVAPLGMSDLPTGDELVAELEEYLRDQRPE
jgi:hypothetical protein